MVFAFLIVLQNRTTVMLLFAKLLLLSLFLAELSVHALLYARFLGKNK